MPEHATIRPAGTTNYVKFRKGAVKEYMDRSAIRLGTPVFKDKIRPGGGINGYARGPKN